MTKEQIQAYIDTSIKGQGNQVDIGSKLGDVLAFMLTAMSNTDNFEEFDEDTSYAKGDVVTKDGVLYQFGANHEGEWDDEDVEQTTLFDILSANIPQVIWLDLDGKVEESEDDDGTVYFEVKGEYIDGLYKKMFGRSIVGLSWADKESDFKTLGGKIILPKPFRPTGGTHTGWYHFGQGMGYINSVDATGLIYFASFDPLYYLTMTLEVSNQ